MGHSAIHAHEEASTVYDFDFSPEALFEPGRARHYFGDAFSNPPDWSATAFSARRALWLAELSRWVYHDSTGEPSPPAHSGQPLDPVELLEGRLFERDGTRAALVTIDGATQGERALVFRGTHAHADWLSNLDALLVPAPRGGLVHKGFSDALDRIWPELSSALETLEGPVIYAGHSLGGALATIAASRRSPHTLYSFGAPRVGNSDFNASLEDTPWFRVVNGRDLVCQVPPPLPPLGFSHGGSAAYIAQDGSLNAEASESFMLRDQWRLEWWAVPAEQRKRLFLDLPKLLTDHAPINYVAQLQRICASAAGHRPRPASEADGHAL